MKKTSAEALVGDVGCRGATQRTLPHRLWRHHHVDNGAGVIGESLAIRLESGKVERWAA